ncbi:single-stranded DNA-binding protein [Nitrosomonas sp.]|uniref:single-stranded DNA-binding protein n=1 Tax=Nitrosomonas sp. TaxID=42353 RepID=UPI00208D68B3|nr:single-stranded DNA-binding protein [Nitrosomonas sp.]GJL76956.1 MAG: hypothetical protein NMNS02_30620 [Nitrosomonas sp.]
MIPVITIEAEEAQFELRTIGQRQVKEQIAYCDLGDKHPKKIKFNLPEHMDRAYPVGEYTPSIESFRVGKYGNLELNPFELKLEPLVTPKTVSKAS